MRSCRLALYLTLVLAAGLLVGAPSVGFAQAAYDSPHGRVEVLGLRRWTLAMLRDSVRRYVPGQDLHDAACMVTLRDSLGFAEASVEHFMLAPPGEPSRTFLSIKVVEPEQAAHVQWDVRPRDDYSSLLPAYAPVILPLTDSIGGVSPRGFEYWLQFGDTAWRARAIARAPASDRADAERLFAFLRTQRSDADRARALHVLARDGSWVNRMAAVAVLGNFAAHDSTWWALARALRDPHERVRGAALMALSALPTRSVDWRPAVGDLRLLLGGTNLPAMRRLIDVLARTKVAPALAPALLRDNGEWLLDHVASEAPGTRDAAQRLLVQLRAGQDVGAERAAWAVWVRSL